MANLTPSVRVRRGHLPRRPGLSHVALLVVSTGARSAERRDLVSTSTGLSWMEGLSTRPFGPWSRRRKGPHAIALPRRRGGIPRKPEGDNMTANADPDFWAKANAHLVRYGGAFSPVIAESAAGNWF